MKTLMGVTLILAGVSLAGYLGIYLMLYGGIMGAITGWGVNNSAVVWGIIRAVLFEFGLVPGILLISGAVAWLTD